MGVEHGKPREGLYFKISLLKCMQNVHHIKKQRR
jgi:hypothetical protein